MPYLSRIPLNPLRRHTQRLLASPQRLHAEVMGGLPDTTGSERLLWRVDTRDHLSELYVLSHRRPSWGKLVEDAGWLGADGGDAQIRDYTSVLDLVVRGRKFAFRVRANPVWRTRHPQKPTATQAEALAAEGRTRGVRVAARTAVHQLAWFAERTSEAHAPWGFTVIDRSGGPRVQLVGRGEERFRKRGTSQPVVLRTATYEGVLTVGDPERFRQTLLGGLGGAKAYGCGLLTLAPVKRGTDVVAG